MNILLNPRNVESFVEDSIKGGYVKNLRESLRPENRNMPLILTGTAILLHDDSKICCQVRDDGKVGMFGGGDEIGESPRECAARELFEESGLRPSAVEDFRLLDVYSGKQFVSICPNGDVVFHHITLFELNILKCTGSLTISDETQAILWLNKKRVEEFFKSDRFFGPNKPIFLDLLNGKFQQIWNFC